MLCLTEDSGTLAALQTDQLSNLWLMPDGDSERAAQVISGKHQGSQGMYPAAVIRHILRIKEMMADDLTIEQIQREFLFVRGD